MSAIGGNEMVPPVKGDRASKEATVYQALDQAFINRISRCFDEMCITSDPEQAAREFVQRFRNATDTWNAAKIALEEEYPKQA
jgi:hypothetical protein